jgi:hypothetical protein
MPQALSKRERECVVGFVEDGHSRRDSKIAESAIRKLEAHQK